MRWINNPYRKGSYMITCYCYEKYKDGLPKGIKITCFREACKNYRDHNEKAYKGTGDNETGESLSRNLKI
jgi:hypothetical protein